jgi:hypothetical protein
MFIQMFILANPLRTVQSELMSKANKWSGGAFLGWA